MLSDDRLIAGPVAFALPLTAVHTLSEESLLVLSSHIAHRRLKPPQPLFLPLELLL